MDELANLSAVIQLRPDFPYDDLIDVAAILEREEVFVPGYVAPPVGAYSVHSYLFEVRVRRFEYWILPDRNLASRIAQVGMGGDVGPDRRAAASLMAFAQCLNLNFDPAIAFHELAHREGNEEANKELQFFRAADTARPQEWVEVSLGRVPRLACLSSLPELTEHDMAAPLLRWRRNYVVALKVAELELQGGPAAQKALKLLEWMVTDFMLGGPAFLFSTVYFSASSQRKGLLKQLRSPLRSRAIDGVRNAAWDLTHISDFVRRVHEESDGSKRFILATTDKGLSRVAGLLFPFDGGEDDADSMVERLSIWWHPADARTIADALFQALSRINDPARRTTPLNEIISTLISRGEEQLMKWNPNK
jgi:hypothetical protein